MAVTAYHLYKRSFMKTRTKYTLIVFGIFILELLPIPFSSIYSLYAIRKRPDWLPNAIDRLYADQPKLQIDDELNLHEANFKRVQTQCTIVLAMMFIVDLLVPVVIPTALYVVRVRPKWFKNLIAKLYSDKLAQNPKPTVAPGMKQPSPEYQLELEKKLAELNRSNHDAAKLLVLKSDKRLLQ